jgi:hypothetical protein
MFFPLSPYKSEENPFLPINLFNAPHPFPVNLSFGKLDTILKWMALVAIKAPTKRAIKITKAGGVSPE